MVSSKVVLIDFDNTLFFTEKSIKLAAKEVLGKGLSGPTVRKLDKKIKHRIYELTHSKYYDSAEINDAMVFRLSKRQDYRVVVLTARHSTVQAYTIKSLKNSNIRYDRLLSRNGKAKEMRDEDWKLEVVKRYAKRYDIIEFYDDKPENAAIVKNAGLGAHVSVFRVERNKIFRL